MKFVYPAVFHKEDGKYKASFPDLDCCYAEGDTLDEAVENANAAAFDWITVELEDVNGELPPISEINDIPVQEGDVVRNIAVNIRFFDGWDE